MYDQAHYGSIESGLMLLSTSADHRRVEDDNGDDEAEFGDDASVGDGQVKSKTKKRAEIFQCEKCSKYVVCFIYCIRDVGI
jgi:hypothetical protein